MARADSAWLSRGDWPATSAKRARESRDDGGPEMEGAAVMVAGDTVRWLAGMMMVGDATEEGSKLEATVLETDAVSVLNDGLSWGRGMRGRGWRVGSWIASGLDCWDSGAARDSEGVSTSTGVGTSAAAAWLERGVEGGVTLIAATVGGCGG